MEKMIGDISPEQLKQQAAGRTPSRARSCACTLARARKHNTEQEPSAGKGFNPVTRSEARRVWAATPTPHPSPHVEGGAAAARRLRCSRTSPRSSCAPWLRRPESVC
eukprot:1497044-Pleurochrysis_carterae.AAC.3